MIRQEVLNVHLAELLCKLGLRATAERVGVKRKTPDLILVHPILGTLLAEAEIGRTWDDKKAKEKLRERAKQRFSDKQFSYIDFVVLIIYPSELIKEASSVSELEIEEVLKQNQLGVGLAFRLGSQIDASLSWYPDPVFPTQITSVLESLAKDVLGELIKPEEVIKQINDLIEKAANYVKDTSDENWVKIWEEIAKQMEIDCKDLKIKDCVYLAAKTLYVLAAISLMIYEIARIRFPDKLNALPKTLNFQSLSYALDNLGKKINYLEIVNLLSRELKKVPPDETLVKILSELYRIISSNINLLMRNGWDTLATIYQNLLSETYRKAYATYYTKLPAARLLSELSVESPYDKVIDPAMGTGSLLISSFYVRQWLGLNPDMINKLEDMPIIDKLSDIILKNTWGADALRGAVALSASNLIIASLAIPHKRLHLYHTPVGETRAGSLDLLQSVHANTLKDLFDNSNTLDLVIMNPPFTRSDRIPNLIGNTARKRLLQTELRFGEVELQEIFTAGLAKPFLALAEELIHEKGRIAAVLPNTMLSRPAWKDIREGIIKGYTVKYVVLSWAPGTPNFSSDTSFREILIVLKRGKTDEQLKVINLLKPVDLLDIGDIAIIAKIAKSGEGTAVRIKEDKVDILAQIAALPQSVLRKYPDNFYRIVAFFDQELLKWHIDVVDKCCVKLGDLFDIGSVVDHTTGLKILPDIIGDYRAIWGSGCNVVKRVSTDPTHSIIVENEQKAKVKFWTTQKRSDTFYFGDIFILRRGRLNTQCVLTIRSNKPVVSNVWWPLRLKESMDPNIANALAVFVNSSFGFIHLLGERLETEGLYVEFKKEQLKTMPIPDFSKILINDVLEEILNISKLEMPRFDLYLSEMAKIEQKMDTWMKAAEYASKHVPDLAPRAKLDLIAIDMLKQVNPELEPPTKLYEILWEETQRLKDITEKSKDAKSVPDKGLTKIKRSKELPLTKFFEDT